jgi:hypothetical protein
MRPYLDTCCLHAGRVGRTSGGSRADSYPLWQDPPGSGLKPAGCHLCWLAISRLSFSQPGKHWVSAKKRAGPPQLFDAREFMGSGRRLHRFAGLPRKPERDGCVGKPMRLCLCRSLRLLCLAFGRSRVALGGPCTARVRQACATTRSPTRSRILKGSPSSARLLR